VADIIRDNVSALPFVVEELSLYFGILVIVVGAGLLILLVVSACAFMIDGVACWSLEIE
jgi:hypothetical protein